MTVVQFHNAHKGQTCIIIGNGPSLRSVPDSFLASYPTFGTNRIYLRYIPTYYVTVNDLVLSQNRADIEALPCEKFVTQRSGVAGHILFTAPNLVPHTFSFSPDQWVYEGHTVTFVCLQLAYYFGFETVLLVGVDHRYQFNGRPNQKAVVNGDDPNHFDPAYFKGQEWNHPDLARSEIAYNMAEQAYNRHGRRIFNLTPGSALRVFEKGNIEEWVKK